MSVHLDDRLPGEDDHLDAALQIARELAANAIWHDDRCAFLGATAPAQMGMPARYRAFGGDVYEGSAGVARFLALAAVLGGDEATCAAALGAARHGLARCDGWSLFAGGAGQGLVALEVADLLEEDDLVAPAVAMIDRASEQALAEARDGRAPADLLVGTAGVIIALLAADCHDRGGRWHDRAVELGDLLIGSARPIDDGLAWPLAPGSQELLCGLAHGAAGVALALDRLARAVSGGDRFADAARRGRAYERRWYDRRHGSWADLRADVMEMAAGNPVCPHYWCHGSVGIGADRMAADGDDLYARADAMAALAGARAEARRLISGPCGPASGDQANASQCHGMAGLIDLLVDAWLIDGESSHLMLARECAGFMRNDARRAGGWRSGVPGGDFAPGLMLGLAGTGWALLRIALPDVIPSCWQLGSALGCNLSGRLAETANNAGMRPVHSTR
jgi:lantibiotic biosynthesis protein